MFVNNIYIIIVLQMTQGIGLSRAYPHFNPVHHLVWKKWMGISWAVGIEINPKIGLTLGVTHSNKLLEWGLSLPLHPHFFLSKIFSPLQSTSPLIRILFILLMKPFSRASVFAVLLCSSGEPLCGRSAMPQVRTPDTCTLLPVLPLLIVAFPCDCRKPQRTNYCQWLQDYLVVEGSLKTTREVRNAHSFLLFTEGKIVFSLVNLTRLISNQSWVIRK